MKTLLLSPYSPYPQNHGSAHRIHHILSYLNTLNFDIDFICNDKDVDSIQKNNYFKKYSGIAIPLSGKHVFLKQNNFKLLFRFLKLVKSYDVIQIEFPYFLIPLCIAKLFRKKVILDEHNVEFNFNKGAYKNSFFLTRGIILFLTWISESISLHLADKVFVCSSIDKKQISSLYKIPSKKISIIPNGVDVSLFQKYKKTLSAKKTFSFLGATSHGANKEALLLLRDNILPQLDSLLIKKRKSLTFLCLSNGSKELFSSISFKNINIICKENFISIPKELSHASLCLAPIITGSGTRIKILEYFASHSIVLGTSKAFEGLQVKHNHDVIIENSLDNYADVIFKILFGKYNHLNKITFESFNTVKKYDWNLIAKKINRIYKDLEND